MQILVMSVQKSLKRRNEMEIEVRYYECKECRKWITPTNRLDHPD